MWSHQTAQWDTEDMTTTSVAFWLMLSCFGPLLLKMTLKRSGRGDRVFMLLVLHEVYRSKAPLSQRGEVNPASLWYTCGHTGQTNWSLQWSVLEYGMIGQCDCTLNHEGLSQPSTTHTANNVYYLSLHQWPKQGALWGPESPQQMDAHNVNEVLP